MENNRSFSVKYRFLLNLCRLFKLQRVMELPSEKIVVLEGGKISSGTHDELMSTNLRYSRFIKLREEAANWKI